MNSIRGMMVLLVLWLCAPAAGAAESEVLSIDELQQAVDLIYPRTSRGLMHVTLHSPSVEWLGDDRVKFTFDSMATTVDQSARYDHILVGVSGRLFESNGVLRLKEIEQITLDSKTVDLEYRPLVERQINIMVANDLIVEPVLRIERPLIERRYWPRFKDKSVTIVGSRN